MLRGSCVCFDERLACPLQAHIAKLESRVHDTEKQNQDLTWQIAMLAKDPEAPPLPSKPQHQAATAFQEAAGCALLSHNQSLSLACKWHYFLV